MPFATESLDVPIPCLKCLSTSELEQLKFLLWASGAGVVPADFNGAFEASSDLAIVGDKGLLEREVAVLKYKYLPNTSFETLISDAKCLHCFDPKKLRAAMLYVMDIALNGS